MNSSWKCQAGSASLRGIIFRSTSYKFLYSSAAIVWSSSLSVALFWRAYFLSLSCLNTFRNYSVSLSYLASRSSRDRSTLVMGLNILTLISSSLKYQLIYLNMRTISLRYSIEFFTYVECLLCIISTSFFKSAQATSGVIPILKVELWSTADIQSKATAMSAWERVYNALSILPCFQ